MSIYKKGCDHNICGDCIHSTITWFNSDTPCSDCQNNDCHTPFPSGIDMTRRKHLEDKMEARMNEILAHAINQGDPIYDER